MSEQRWRANMISNTVDEIVIVNETDQYVDVQHPASGGWAGSIRREAKLTAYSKICKSERDALESLAAYARKQMDIAESAAARWRANLTAVRVRIGKIDVADTP